MKDFPIFQGLAKSVVDTQGNIKKLSEQFDGFDKRILSEFVSLEQTLMTRMIGQPPPEESTGKTGEEGPAEPSLSDRGETPSKILTEEQERMSEGETKEEEPGSRQRPNSLGPPDKILVTMWSSYKAGPKPF